MKMMEDDNKNRSCPLLITNMNIMNSSTKLYSISAVSFCLLISLLPCGASAQVVGFPASKTALELRRNVFEQGRKSDQPFANFRLFMKYQLPAGQEGAVHLGQHIKLNLLSGNHVMSIEPGSSLFRLLTYGVRHCRLPLAVISMISGDAGLVLLARWAGDKP